MAWLDNILNSNKNDLPESWNILDDISMLDSIFEESHEHPIALFKHSTRCGISLHAKERLETKYDLDGDQLGFYYLDLLKNRAISNEIANRFNVVHQSPQVIVLKDGVVVYQASHAAISLDELRKLKA